MNKVFKVEGLDCAACASELEEIISKIKGVREASVDFMAQKVRFECDSDEVVAEVARRCNSFENVKVVDGAPAAKGAPRPPGFCQIPSKTIYEDDLVKAFLEINPISDGHILLIPKTHYTNFLDTPNETIKKMYEIIKTKIYPLLQEKLNIQGLSICQIGKDVKHYHIHLIPQYENVEFNFKYDKTKINDINKIYAKLTSK